MIHERTFRAILVGIATSGNTIKTLRELGINPREFYGMLGRSAEHANRYARAKMDGLEALADETLAISDGEPPTLIRGDDGIAVLSLPDEKRDRLRVDTRKWLLAKLAPKKYGERTIVAGDAENPLVVEQADALAALLQRPAIADRESGTAREDGETLQ